MPIVYVLINEAMPGLVKIGRTESDLENRMRQLDSSGVPLPFECFHASCVNDAVFVEKRLHEAFADKRIRPNREFFDVDPQQVASAMQLAELEDVTPKDDVLTEPTDKAALDHARQIASAFNFEMVDIPKGATLQFSKNETITATVANKKQIIFEGETTSLTAAALKLIHDMGYTWTKIQGPGYWMYEGETLAARRKRMESED